MSLSEIAWLTVGVALVIVGLLLIFGVILQSSSWATAGGAALTVAGGITALIMIVSMRYKATSTRFAENRKQQELQQYIQDNVQY